MTESEATIERVRANLARVRDRIATAGGDPEHVEVVAVTKGFDATAPMAALAAGLQSLGESYAQELASKAAEVGPLEPAPRWHFIGNLQSNKVRMVADVVSCWQSVDRASLVKEIAKRAPGATVFVQVNATGEPQKGGCRPSEAASLVERAVGAGLVVDGLMAIGRAGDLAATRRAFADTVELADRLGLRHRSLGMSADLEVAVEAGATMVRVGTDLFGPRPG